MKTTCTELDALAMQPAPPPFVPSGDTLPASVNELVATIHEFKIIRLDGRYKIVKQPESDEVLYEVGTAPRWELNSFEDLSESRGNRRFILSGQLEDRIIRILKNPEAHRRELDVSSVSHGVLLDLVAYREFSNAFSKRTKTALYSGYLPRHHLGLAVLFERYPELLEFVALFPVLLTYIAERLLHGHVDEESYLKDLGIALGDGWRGLFGFCGFPLHKSMVTYLKNIILSSEPMGIPYEFDEPQGISFYLETFREAIPEQLPIRLPIHETVLNQFHRIKGFTTNSPKWVNWQINQHQRIFPDGVTTHSMFGLMRRIWPSMKPVNLGTEIEALKDSCIPFIDIRECSQCGSDGLLSPEEYRKLPAKEKQEREALFKSGLTAEEQAQFRYLLDENDHKVIVSLLQESTDYSKELLWFFHSWNHEEVDRALIEQVSLPVDLILFLSYRFPEEILSSPAYNFHCLFGNSIEQDKATCELFAHIQRGETAEFSHPDVTDPFPFFQRIVQLFGHTSIGVSLASCRTLTLPSLLAKLLRRTPQGPVWEALLQNPQWEVRACLTMNPYAPEWVRNRLARDPAEPVRILLAEQPWFMIHEIIDNLKADQSAHVQSALAFNPGIPAAAGVPDNCSNPEL